MGKKKFDRRNTDQADHKKEISDESFKQMMSETYKPVRTLEVGEKVDSTVIGFDNDSVFLDMGSRLDGVLKRSELSQTESKNLEEGQTISVLITGRKSGIWQTSRRLGAGDSSGKDTARDAAVVALDDAYKRGIPVEGKISDVNKGGFEVQVMGQKAFCPISQIDKVYCENPNEHLNQTYTFEIIRFEESGRNIVVSRRKYLEKEAEKRAKEIWNEIQEEKVYDGRVTSIQNFGVFVDIGGVEGLLHISEASYDRGVDVTKAYNVGQTLKVSVKHVDWDKRKISFTVKPFLTDPWTAAVSKLSQGGEFQGKVVRMKTFGAFIELFPGVDGMVHVSRLGTDKRHQHPKEVLNLDDIVTVRVMEIDEQNKRISLTMEKEEGDFSADLERLKNEQEKASHDEPTQMSSLFDEALKDKKPEEDGGDVE